MTPSSTASTRPPTADRRPVALNTPINEDEPIVRTPAEAVDTFLKTRMDVLVLGNYVVTRDGSK